MLKKKTIHEFIPPGFKVTNGVDLHHEFEPEDCNALWAAYAANRPLLLRGAPGTGKSQAARALAHHLKWAFVKETINGSTELSDLHYHFDAIARLGDAQLKGTRNGENTDLNPLKYLSPGAFWWAYHWPSAKAQYKKCAMRLREEPQYPKEEWEPENGGVVLLIDEIDKAQPDLANGLLETLGDFSFNVPFLSAEFKNDDELINPVSASKDRNLLVVITTNEERELPEAFLRRCFVHTLEMEESEELDEEFYIEGLDKAEKEGSDGQDDYRKMRYTWLIKRGQLHFENKKEPGIHPKAYLHAARLLWKDRENGSKYKPGLAEYIDLLTALSEADFDQQLDLLKSISGYALEKGQR